MEEERTETKFVEGKCNHSVASGGFLKQCAPFCGLFVLNEQASTLNYSFIRVYIDRHVEAVTVVE